MKDRPRVDRDRDRILRGDMPMPESPSTQVKTLTQADVDRHRDETYEAEQAQLREQAEEREARRVERRRTAAVTFTVTLAGRTFRGVLPPTLEASVLEGGMGQHVGRLFVAAQTWAFYAVEAADRAALDPPAFAHGKVWRNGREEACPCASKSCVFRAEALSWRDQFTQVVRQLGQLGILVEEAKS